MAYKVYLNEELGCPNHHAIFVETNEDEQGSGYIYQVTGNIQQGMIHEHRKSNPPNLSPLFECQHYLGTISEANYGRVRTICDNIPPPEKQFDGPKKIDPKRPIINCQNWCQDAIEALKQEGVLEAAKGG